MVWSILLHLLGFIVDLLTATHRADQDKDVEILLLRHQLRILQRKQPHPPRISRWEKLTRVVLAGKLTTMPNRARARLSKSSSCSSRTRC